MEPIASAPRDGRSILLYVSPRYRDNPVTGVVELVGDRFVIASWRDGGWTRAAKGQRKVWHVTHWSPLVRPDGTEMVTK